VSCLQPKKHDEGERVIAQEVYYFLILICSSSNCSFDTAVGAPIIRSRLSPVLGNAITSRILGSPNMVATKRSIPGAIPPCGGTPYSNALSKWPNCSCMFCFVCLFDRDPSFMEAQIAQKLKLKNIKTEQALLTLQNLHLDAKAAISVEIDEKGTRRIIYAKNIEEPLPIASLTKLMTALVVLDLDETYRLSELVSVTEQSVLQEGRSKYGELRSGERLSAGNLLSIMLIESSNDAAYALADVIGSDGFVALMNLYAKELKLDSTTFVNATGLEPDNLAELMNVSTTQDLATLAEIALEAYPSLFDITKQYSFEVLREDGSLHHFIPENTNILLREIPEIIGGKTGWGPAARGCLLLVLKGEGRVKYRINVILGAEDRFGEMKKLIEGVDKARHF